MMKVVFNDEEYLPLEEFPNYFVSKSGAVLSTSKSWIRPQVLRPKTDRGYKNVSCVKDGKTHYRWVHRLVARAWLPPTKNGKRFVNHKNGNRGDNRVENLEWCTHIENMNHARQVLGWKNSGDQNASAKLTALKVKKMRQQRASGVSLKQLARRYSVSQAAVSMACRQITWRD